MISRSSSATDLQKKHLDALSLTPMVSPAPAPQHQHQPLVSRPPTPEPDSDDVEPVIELTGEPLNSVTPDRTRERFIDEIVDSMVEETNVTLREQMVEIFKALMELEQYDAIQTTYEKIQIQKNRQSARDSRVYKNLYYQKLFVALRNYGWDILLDTLDVNTENELKYVCLTSDYHPRTIENVVGDLLKEKHHSDQAKTRYSSIFPQELSQLTKVLASMVSLYSNCFEQCQIKYTQIKAGIATA